MKIFYTDHFVLPLPETHRFPMQKYALLRERVTTAGLVPPENLCVPAGATDRQIQQVHHPDYLQRVKTGQLTRQEVRQIGFPWSPELVERSRRSCGATIEACRAALEDGFAVNLAGGTHHASYNQGQGYCVFNDSAIAARAMQTAQLVKRVVIIDCDVHQGNGTADIFYDDPSVFTFSIHAAKNFPFRKSESDLDIALADGADDQIYLSALEQGLYQALKIVKANLAIYLAGADPFIGDRLGRLALSKIGLAQRDQLVFQTCQQANIPVAITMSGGYAPLITDIIDIHFQTVANAAKMGNWRNASLTPLLSQV